MRGKGYGGLGGRRMVRIAGTVVVVYIPISKPEHDNFFEVVVSPASHCFDMCGFLSICMVGAYDTYSSLMLNTS